MFGAVVTSLDLITVNHYHALLVPVFIPVSDNFGHTWPVDSSLPSFPALNIDVLDNLEGRFALLSPLDLIHLKTIHARLERSRRLIDRFRPFDVLIYIGAWLEPVHYKNLLHHLAPPLCFDDTLFKTNLPYSYP